MYCFPIPALTSYEKHKISYLVSLNNISPKLSARNRFRLEMARKDLALFPFLSSKDPLVLSWLMLPFSILQANSKGVLTSLSHCLYFPALSDKGRNDVPLTAVMLTFGRSFIRSTKLFI